MENISFIEAAIMAAIIAVTSFLLGIAYSKSAVIKAKKEKTKAEKEMLASDAQLLKTVTDMEELKAKAKEKEEAGKSVLTRNNGMFIAKQYS